MGKKPGIKEHNRLPIEDVTESCYLKETNKIKCTSYEYNQLEELILEHNFWKLPINDPIHDFAICKDGETWIIEVLKNNRYHFIKRWSPESFRSKSWYPAFVIEAIIAAKEIGNHLKK